MAGSRIRRVVQRIQDRKDADMTAIEFLDAFLEDLVSAVSARGGAVWLPADEGWETASERNLPLILLDQELNGRQQHDALLEAIFRSNVPRYVEPRWGLHQPQWQANPTDLGLALATITYDETPLAVVELLIDVEGAATDDATKRGFVTFLVSMCQIASASRALRDS